MEQAILSITLIGLMVAAVAKIIVPGEVGQGFFRAMCVAVIGAFLGAATGWNENWFEEGRTTGLMAAMCGAIVTLCGYRYLRHRHQERRQRPARVRA